MTTENIFRFGYFAFSAIFGLLRLLAMVGLIVFGIIKMIQFIKKKHLFKHKKALIISLICIVVTAASWFFNMGWFRVIMTFMLIPIVQPLLFLITNLYASLYTAESPGVKVINLFFIITHLMFWVLLPDFADIGPTYFLFNLVRHDDLSMIALMVACMAGLAHIVLFIIQMVQFLKFKKRADSV
ncbi:MAG: hypothetical protein E7403_06230 [Ruminococcaceae bacterium]|nr:hypothetical protein [Oscillospiraceae bacterium]